MSIPVLATQTPTFSAKARDFLKAAPMLRLPGFMWSFLVRPAAIAKQRKQFQAAEDLIEEALIASGNLMVENGMIGAFRF